MSADFRFVLTFFRDYAASEKRERRCTIYELADLARDTTAATKAELPWWKCAAFGERRTTKNSLRHDANVKYVTGGEWDYDGGVMVFDEAAELLEKLGVMALLYTSPSHTEDAPRWRILCPFSIGMMPEKRHNMIGRLNGAFRGIFSRESWTLSQSYYYGAPATLLPSSSTPMPTPCAKTSIPSPALWPPCPTPPHACKAPSPNGPACSPASA